MPATQSPMRSLERAIDVLEVLDSARGSLRLNEIARRAELPVATTQRILAVLESRGRVEKDSNGYRPGIALTFGAHAFSITNPLIRAARPVLIELASLTGLTVTLFNEYKGQRVVLSRAGTTRNFGYELVIGSRLPLYIGAGKALLAQMNDGTVEQLLSAAAQTAPAPSTPVPTRSDLLEDLAKIRQRGYSISREEREPGVASVAAAIPSDYGVMAAVQATGTIDDFPEDQTQALGRQVHQAAISIGHGLPEASFD
ncbi:IclR family transcriptional regulator [Brevibacterium permense]|uniref:IclR family transcriptional regulator n=1 Tax=Brevibacterium permense TaxID=234834 RepID=UPI0021CE620F|nr:IclR family transcriptional regulator [Brevibacterium permense]MCU4295855.1 IclR family transcriptional regulator [Brevibacterium permense]